MSRAGRAGGTSSGCTTGVDAALIGSIIQDPAGFYVNVHNSEFPGGAVRGQLAVPTAILAAALTGREEVPAGDPDGSGYALVVLNQVAGTVCFQIAVSAIGLPASGSHIHRGGLGVAGPIVVPFVAPGAGGTSSGCTTGVDAALIGSIIQDPAGFYVNVHNSEFPGGAVRGQLVTVLVPALASAPTPTAPPATPIPTPSARGGRGFGITVGGQGVGLSWLLGTGQSGYVVVQLGGGPPAVVSPGLLPPSATSMTAQPAPGQDPICYVLLVLGASPQDLRVSDLLCILRGTPAGAVRPRTVTLRLNQSSTASLSWGPPAAAKVVIYQVVPLGSAPLPVPAHQTQLSYPMSGPTCFAVVAFTSAGAGFHAPLCGIPGVSNLGAGRIPGP